MKKLYMTFPLALILCFMVGCQDKEAMAELEEFKAQAALEEQNKALISNYLKEIDNKNFEILNEVYAPDAKMYLPSNSSEPMSVEQSIPSLKSFYDAFPDFSHSIEELIAVGDKVILRAIDRGTHQGELNGIPATGKSIEFSVIAIFYFEDGKIVEVREDVDFLGLYQQLGMELKPKEGEKQILIRYAECDLTPLSVPVFPSPNQGVSDHLPMWVELKIDFSDEYLRYKLNLTPPNPQGSANILMNSESTRAHFNVLIKFLRNCPKSSLGSHHKIPFC